VKNALRARGLLDGDGGLTDAGVALRAGIEAQTDAAAAAPYDHLGADKTERLVTLVQPWAAAIKKQVFG